MNNNLTNELKHWILYNWKLHPPKFFITLLWKDLPSSQERVSSYQRKFKNVFLTKLYQLNKTSKLKSLPFPKRVGMMVFNEKKEVFTSKSHSPITSFHTHIHLCNTDNLFDDEVSVERFIKDRCSDYLPTLLKTDTEGNQGVVVKGWNQQHHLHYNFKDLQLYKHHQDCDLLIDYHSSDLLPLKPL